MILDALCLNTECVYAGWCKRFSYKQSRHYRPGKLPEKMFNCENGEYFIKNKAREIYERDNNVGRNDQLKRTEHPHNNREPGMREDNEIDTGIEAHLRDWGGRFDPDSILQLQHRSDRRSSYTSPSLSTTCGYTLDQAGKNYYILREPRRSDIEAYRQEMYYNLEKRLREWSEKDRKITDAILQNITLDGISPARSERRFFDDIGRSEEVLEDGPATDVGPDNAE